MAGRKKERRKKKRERKRHRPFYWTFAPTAMVTVFSVGGSSDISEAKKRKKEEASNTK